MEKAHEINPGRQIRRFSSHAEQEAETMRYWRDRPASEKMSAVTELAEYAYRMRGIDVHAQGPKGPVVRVQRDGVEYLVVGGHAVNIHGGPRLTKDLDVLIRSSVPKSERVYRALLDFGAPLQGYGPADFYGHPDDILQIGVEPNRIDVLQSISGVNFDETWIERVNLEVEDGVQAPFLSSTTC